MPNQQLACSVIELPDLVVDACITDHSCNLIFGSFWGRDTAIQELLARITLNPSESLALTSITLDGAGIHSPVFFHKDLLEKKIGRSYPGTLFGSMTHLWLLDRRALEPDYANHSAYLLYGADEEALAKTWPLICDLAPYPLQEHWKPETLRVIALNDMMVSMKTILGKVTCFQISLNVEILQQSLSQSIRSGKLSALPEPAA
ncbi:MAG: hypothetical protein LBE75_05250 [Burkholderiales bacterium]|jgi:hypothetical protein|nr:hypothetical protein [Burkholderiales bacterium]